TVVNEMERQVALRHLEPARIHRLLEQQTELLPESAGFRITDAKGAVLIGVGDNSSRVLNIADREYFAALSIRNEPGLVISKPVVGHVTQEWIIPFARSYRYPDGRFAGVVSVPISVAFFNRMLTRFDVGPSGATSLRDRDLGLIARYPPDSKGQKLAVGSNNISQAMRDLANTGTIEKTYSTRAPYDQTVRVNTFLRVSNAPFYIIAGVAQDEYLKSWRRELWQTLVFFALFVLATSFLARMVYRAWSKQEKSNLVLLERNSELATALTELAERDHALVAAQRAGSLGTYTLDFETGKLVCSDEINRIFGLDESEEHNVELWRKCIHPDDAHEVEAHFQVALQSQTGSFSDEHRIVRRDGSVRWIQRLGELERDSAGKPLRLRGIVQDVSARHSADDRLKLMREAFQHSAEGIMVTDRDGVILEINPAYSGISGFSYEEVLGCKPSLFKSGLHPEAFYREMWQTLLHDGYWEGEFHNKRKDHTVYLQHTRISAIRDSKGEVSRYIALASDVTLLRESQKQIEHMAYHDKLTGLPNRALLADRLRLSLAQAQRNHEILGVCYLDLDGFKPINDEWGHDVGDNLLCQVGQRLLAHVRAGDTVARIGGDEFVVLISGIHTEDELNATVQRLLDTVALPFQINKQTAYLTMSIGVAAYPNDQAQEPDSLIRHADQAMYIAKHSGKNRMHLFDAAAEKRLREHHDLLSGVASALEADEFELYYQPKVNMRSGEVIGAEALIRWNHPAQGLLSPGVFLSAVQDTEYAVTMGEWVIRKALQQISTWQSTGFSPAISVNIFGYHLQRSNFVGRLSILLAEFPNVSPSLLELEILETTVMEDIEEISECIEKCNALGVRFALDDFGTGYSSLSYFRRLPTQLLKIDQSFVFDMLTNPDDMALVQAIISLARTFRRNVLAEGVESIEHGDALLELGCDLGQGYGIARPMPASEFPAWARAWLAPPSWARRDTVSR
ncbi:MAG TPA: EAL domain-containing protein, partial [Rhodocyclaceae bacterium]|nr:EAL domain-containing protein [Rhodocyclaceae bacterium]